MGKVPNIGEAREILRKYNREDFHLHHAEAVSATLRYFAREHDAENEQFWRTVGLLHDIDFELYPSEHCVKGEELLKAEGVDESVIKSAMSHGFGATETPYEPEHTMEKILFAVDELTGLIGAAALMRPSKSTLDLEYQSLMKKFKDRKFAAGCSRDVISLGAECLGWTIEKLFSETILAMREFELASK